MHGSVPAAHHVRQPGSVQRIRDVAVGLELLAVLPVLDPATAEAEVLAGLDAEEVADDSDEVLLARDRQPHHAPGVLLVDIRDALEGALQRRRVRVRGRHGFLRASITRKGARGSLHPSAPSPPTYRLPPDTVPRRM